MIKKIGALAIMACAMTATSAHAAFDASSASGTLPVITINTEGGVPIVDKETKIPALMDVSVPAAYETLYGGEATELSGVTLTIKGRGNASWKLDKKPYKLKFEKKTAVLGMTKHKHFALIPYAGYLMYFWGVGGMEIARATEQAWTPKAEPCELVLNGEYRGRYFLVESVKIGADRVNIFEQEELCEDPELIPYGWLIELDNNDDEFQIQIPMYGQTMLRVTHKSPELLSDAQRAWLTEEFTKLNAAVYSEDLSGDEWVKYIDAASAAKYFIIREVLWDPDGYSGSIYLHRDKAEGAKWVFGPLWDLNSAARPKYSWIFDSDLCWGSRWFPALIKKKSFRRALVAEWDKFYNNTDRIYAFYDRLASICVGADDSNHKVWPAEGKGSLQWSETAKELLRGNIEWINKEVEAMRGELSGLSSAGVDSDAIARAEGRGAIAVSATVGSAQLEYFSPAGQKVAEATVKGGESHVASGLPAGLYIVKATAASRSTVLKLFLGV